MRNASPQTLAAAWHWADVAVAGAVAAMAVLGLIGHYRLRKSYARWHLSQPRVVA